jgi:hypothetical protein
MVGYNPQSSAPFEIFNPWGTQFNGYAPGCSVNGDAKHQYWGLFYATGSLVSTYFASQSYGVGATNQTMTPTLTLDEPTDPTLLTDSLPKKVVKLGRLANPLIAAIRPTLGMSIVGGLLS